MYAVIRHYRLDPASVAVVLQRVKEDFAPLIKNLPGFVAYSVEDLGEGTLVSVSVFEDETGAKESSELAAQWMKQNLDMFFPHSLPGKLVALEGNSRQEPYESQTEGNNGLRLLSVDEVSSLLGMGKSWVYRKIKSGEIPSVRLGKTIRVKQEDLEEYLKTRRQ